MIVLIRSIFLAGVLGLSFAWTTASHSAEPTDRRIVVLGFDGMDYVLTRRMMKRGDLPHFAELAKEGVFLPLQTTMPPLSPVAWSTFITGTDPGGHGVFDFLRRDPSKVRKGFLPEDAVSRVVVDPDAAPWPIPWTDYVLPPTQRQVNLRHGQAFWHVLEAHGIAATIYKMPANFPVTPGGGRVLAGMGVPDVAGTYGTFTYITTHPADRDRKVSGGRVLPAVLQDGVVTIERSAHGEERPTLHGPFSPFRRAAEAQPSQAPFELYVDPDQRTAAIWLQGAPIVLREGEWSPWVEVEFALLPGVHSVHGLVRFYLQQASEHVRLYVSPIHPAPRTAGLADGDFDIELQRELGYYHTKGMSEATKAVTQGVFSDEEYRQQSRLVLDEKIAALRRLLDQDRPGLLFVYFSSTDLDSHVLWRHRDPEHPAHTNDGAQRHGQAVEELYQEMDRLVGMTRRHMGPNDELYVMSDHGFVSLRLEFNLTTWLRREGYLIYEPGVDPSRSKMFDGVDWTRTRAYPVGFNGLYVNRAGREAQGAVSEADAPRLVEELRRKLLALRDRGHPVFASVYRPTDIYPRGGAKLDEAPDLILGYRPPYGPSDDSVIGIGGVRAIVDRTRGFSGHHAVDYRAVPGILLSSRRLNATRARLQDVTVTILNDFGVEPPDGMTGRPLR